MIYSNTPSQSRNKRISFYRVHLAILTILLAILIGILGYMTIEKLSFVDAIYMSVITLSTVGFGEVKQLSPEGKVFTIILIIIYLSVFTYAVTTITSYVIDGDYRKRLKKFRMEKAIQKLSNHVIVVGYGRNGRKCCEELNRSNVPFLVIENNIKVVEQIIEKGYLYVHGDASEDRILTEANISQAKAIISSLPIDADNVFVVLSARKLNANLNIISRAAQSSSEEKLQSAGANHVIMPEVIGGHYMANLVNRPDLIEFYHLLTEDTDSEITTEELSCSNIKDEYIGKSIMELSIRQKTGVNILALRESHEGAFQLNPSPDTRITKQTIIIVVGTRNQVKNMKEIYKKPVG
jgi:voltage-gated potassium channel